MGVRPAAQLGAFLGRYQLETRHPKHRSATCEVVMAEDVLATGGDSSQAKFPAPDPWG